jgi:catechol 2,3-dioxygenase-like lactoylglutathione lyase family enzyme/ketosteroid isomerase-like protein
MISETATDARTQNVKIARAAYDAYVTKDRAALETLLASDFHFTSPLDNRLNRETYFRRCWPNSEVIEGFDFINLVADADRVFVTYEGRKTNGQRFRNTEILTIRNQHIVDVEVYFGWSVPHKAPQGGFVEQAEQDDSPDRSNSKLAEAHVSTRLPVKDLDRARKFYSEKLGLEPIEVRPGGLRYRCGAGFFALFQSAGSASGTHTQMALEVDDIETTVAALRARGVGFEEYDAPGLETINGIADITGNYPSKGIGERGAWFRDSEGNLLGLGQPVRRSQP